MYIDEKSLRASVESLFGTSGHLLKIWFTLKHMGLSISNQPVDITTSNSKQNLDRLFSFGDPKGDYFIPFAHTTRYLKMKHDASRSIVQTTIQRWASSGSVVSCDPTGFLDIKNENNKLTVDTGRQYPLGLGNGESGFAINDDSRVSIPITAFAVWYGRTTKIPESKDAKSYLIDNMLTELNISQPERSLIFESDDFDIRLQRSQLTDGEIFQVCKSMLEAPKKSSEVTVKEKLPNYKQKVKSMVSRLELPTWLREQPLDELNQLLESGNKAMLLTGPPRTGKTRAIDSIVHRASTDRETIQIHDGWGYENLIEGFMPDSNGNWSWVDGPLKKAIEEGKKWIVLEEINRTSITQALGEVFSLIEEVYRGDANGILTRSGKNFYIPQSTVFLMTMNTLDKSTEEVDDALFGRLSVVDFPPRVEDLNEMLMKQNVNQRYIEKLSELFTEIQNTYPLGHGYFSALNDKSDSTSVLRLYKSRIRPVLFNYLGELQSHKLNNIDNLVDELFG